MDLDGYEADLADFTLQETPFYETAYPSAYDLMQRFEKSTMKSNDGKKKRKCVSFLPNYVQVNLSNIYKENNSPYKITCTDVVLGMYRNC